MSDVNATSGATTTASGVVDGQVEPKTDPVGTSGSTGNVQLEKVLKEKRNAMQKIADLEAKLQASEEAKLTEQEQFRTLAEQRLKRVEELEAKIATTDKVMEKAKKVAAVKKHLSVMGLKSEHEDLALNKLLDVEDLMLDPDTGTVLGAEEKAKTFRQTYAGLGIFGKQGPGVENNAPSLNVNSTKSAREMSRDELVNQLKQVI